MNLKPTQSRRGGTAMVLVAGLAALGGCGNSEEGASVVTTVSQRVMAEQGLSPGQLVSPRCIENDGRDLWVIDKDARVQRLDAKTGKCLSIFKMPEYGFGKPTGLTIVKEPGKAESNLLFIADTHYHRVRVYRVPAVAATTMVDQEPELVSQFGSFGREGGQFVFPTDIAVAHGANGNIERVYVSEYGGNDRVSVFDGNYKYLFSFGQFGVGELGDATIEFSRPQSVAVDQVRRELVVTDGCNHRIGVFTLDGKLIRWVGGTDGARGTSDAPGSFSYPYGLALVGDGTAVVSEFGNGRAQHIDLATGHCLGMFGGPKEDDGSAQRLGNAWGLTILNGEMFVLDMRRSRIVCHQAPAKR